ncbi:MAG: PH domain-containing protein [Actinobacteria bacterium]|nr:PH domain-containing protein [Actinomycetota bacterium]MCA1720217.1 PH domain-containing protein [Actinomycetota bacterium]
MAYPTKLLAEDERLVLDLHPHWKALITPVITLVLVLGIGGFVAARIPEGDRQGLLRLLVLVVALALLAAYAVRPFLRWITTHFVITDRRVLVRSGVLSRNGRDVPLSRINDITFSHTFLERLLGCGTLVVESAGERGQVTLSDVPKVERVQRQLYDLVEHTDERLRGPVREA